MSENEIEAKLTELGYKYEKLSNGCIQTGRPLSEPVGKLFAVGLVLSGSPDPSGMYRWSTVPLQMSGSHGLRLLTLKEQGAEGTQGLATTEEGLIVYSARFAGSQRFTGLVSLDKLELLLDRSALLTAVAYTPVAKEVPSEHTTA